MRYAIELARPRKGPARVLRRSPVLILLVLSLILAACGGEGDSTADEPDTQGAGDPTADEADAQDGGEGEEETFEVELAGYLPENLPLTQGIEWWAQEVESRSDGQVTFERFYGGTLYEAAELRDALADGRIGAAHFGAAYHADDFVLTDGVLSPPFVTTNAPAVAETILDLYAENESARDEWESQGLRLVAVTPVPPPVLGANSPLESLDDLEGLDIRAVAGMIPPLDIIGANPVGMAAPDIYEALQRGVLDGFTAIPLDVGVLQSFHEVTTHWVDPGFGSYGNTHFALSLETWNSFPADIQDMMDEVAREMITHVLPIYKEAESAACDTLLEEGVTITAFDDSEIDRWQEMVGDQVYEEWASDVETRGVDPDAYYQEFLDKLEAAEQVYADYTPGIEACFERAQP